jgi:hypothetical protein
MLIGAAVFTIYKLPGLWPSPVHRQAQRGARHITAVWRRLRKQWYTLRYNFPGRQRWATYAEDKRRRVRAWLAEPANRLTLGVSVGALVLLTLGGMALIAPPGTRVHTLAPALITVAVVVLVVDALYRVRLGIQEKQRIIRQMGSRSHVLALDAVRHITGRGWHRDGSLREASFDYAVLVEAGLTHADLQGASFRHTDLRRAELMFAQLQNARLGNADLRGANLSFADLHDAILSLANLEGASLGRCRLHGAHVEGANLRDAFLEDAEFDGAHLEQVIFNERTRWPSGYLPPRSAVNWDLLDEASRDWYRQWRWYLYKDEG